MGYYRKRIVTGAVIEIEKIQKFEKTQHKNTPRASKEKPTPDQMFANNERTATAKLRRIINANFAPGDYHVTLPYKRGQYPTPQEARKQFEQFIRRLRREYQKAEGRELKYIHVTEHLRGNIHHHLIVQHCDPRIISDLWMKEQHHQRPYFSILDQSGQYKKLAEYLIKETSKTFRSGESAYRKRWCESKNLHHPKSTTKRIKAKKWREAPEPEQGYYIETDSIETGTNPFTGLMWQRYSMIRIRP